MPRIPRTRLIFLSVLLLLPFVLYAPAVPGPMLFDDSLNIQENHWIQITDLSLTGLYGAATQGDVPNRPLPKLTYALNHLAHGLETPGFHLVNIALHGFAAMALFALFGVTLVVLSPERFRGRADRLAFFAALLWAAHPLQSQGVAYIVQRMTSMAALFFFLSLFLYARGRLASGRGRARLLFAGCALSGIFALASKENAVTLPAFLLLYEWFFFQKLSPAWLKRHAPWLFASAAALVVAGLVYTDFSPLAGILASYDFREFTPAQRLYTELRVVVFYLSLLVFPWPGRQSLLHDFTLSDGFLSPPATLASAALLVGLLVLAVAVARRRTLLSFAVLWLLGNLVLESSFYGLELVFEHRMYMPSAFLFLAGVLFLDRVAARPRVAWAAVLCLAAVLSGFTWERSRLWGDGIALMREAAEKAPTRGRVFHNLALGLILSGDIPGAREAQEKSIELDETLHNSLMDRGKALAGANQAGQAARLLRQASELRWRIAEECNNLGVLLAQAANEPAAATDWFQKAVEVCPQYWQARDNLGMALYNLGRKDEALEQLRKGVELNPEPYQAMNNLGHALAGMGRIPEAMEWYRKSLAVFPSYVTARVNLADAAASDSRPVLALTEYRRALADRPGDPNVLYRLGRVLFTSRAPESAAEHLGRAVALDPSNKAASDLLAYVDKYIRVTRKDIGRALNQLQGNPGPANRLHLHRALATLYTRLGEDESALTHARDALALAGTAPEAENEVGMVLMRLSRYDEARGHFEKAAGRKDENQRRQALYHLAASRALEKDHPGAAKALSLLFENGFDQWEILARDADFENVRDLPFFRENVILRAREIREAREAGGKPPAGE